jgi:hypothetical protein
LRDQKVTLGLDPADVIDPFPGPRRPGTPEAVDKEVGGKRDRASVAGGEIPLFLGILREKRSDAGEAVGSNNAGRLRLAVEVFAEAWLFVRLGRGRGGVK